MEGKGKAGGCFAIMDARQWHSRHSSSWWLTLCCTADNGRPVRGFSMGRHRGRRQETSRGLRNYWSFDKSPSLICAT